MNSSPNNRATWIQATLQKELSPSFLEVVDEGWKHVGHAEEGAGHFKVRIASSHFAGLTLVECHRLIYTALGDAVGKTIHALQIEIQS